jgi:hypothetical protein
MSASLPANSDGKLPSCGCAADYVIYSVRGKRATAVVREKSVRKGEMGKRGKWERKESEGSRKHEGTKSRKRNKGEKATATHLVSRH